jgi:FAD/FMN-containing dehydrogenase
MFLHIAEFIFTVGLTLGVGSSTFALIFFIRALQDGVIDASEKRFMHTVYTVLRIGMVLIFVGLIGSAFLDTISLQLGLQLALLSIITINAILMTKRIMSMRFGPILAGGSWYSLFLVTQTSIASLGVVVSGVAYILFLIAFYNIFEYLKQRFIPAKGSFAGEVFTDQKTRDAYATDASAFKLMPQAVYAPKHVADIQALIQMCRENRKSGGTASLTVRAGGTDMSGGPLTTGWIVDLTTHMNRIEIDPVKQTATVEMGAYFRDIEAAAKQHGLMFAPYPSSRLMCGIGGMIGNNASGEKSLRHGATSDNVLALDVVFADGSVRHIAPKSLKDATSPDESVLIDLYRTHGAALKKATGNVKKAASGYRLEKVVQKQTLNAVPLFVGAQGTLGIVTSAVLKLVPIPAHTDLLLISATELGQLSDIVKMVSLHNPEALETFDINTYKKAQEHLAEHARAILPHIDGEAQLFILAQFSESTPKETQKQAMACSAALKERGYVVAHVTDAKIVDAAWQVRRNSFTLMRDHNPEGWHAVPCIEDVIVPLSALGVFIGKLQDILKKRRIQYGFHGHIGDGSFRIIPIFNFATKTLEKDIHGLMTDVFALVKKVKGNLSADHSDGIIRTPYLKEFYGESLYGVFETIKHTYDPENIMNPGKKVGGSVEALNKSLNRG